MSKISRLFLILAVVFGFASATASAGERSVFCCPEYRIYSSEYANLVLKVAVLYHGEVYIDIRSETIRFVVDESLPEGTALMEAVLSEYGELEYSIFDDCLFGGCELSELTVFVSSSEEKKQWEVGLAAAREKRQNMPPPLDLSVPLRVTPPMPR